MRFHREIGFKAGWRFQRYGFNLYEWKYPNYCSSKRTLADGKTSTAVNFSSLIPKTVNIKHL